MTSRHRLWRLEGHRDSPNGQPCRGCCCLIFIGYCHIFMFLYLYTDNYNSCITHKPVHYTCGPAVAGHCWSGISPRRSASDRSGISSDALRHTRMGIKNKSNDNKTTLVALLTSLLLGGGICASGKFAWANISTRSTSTEGRELSWCRLCHRWWHWRLSKWQPLMLRVMVGWHRGDSLSSNA